MVGTILLNRDKDENQRYADLLIPIRILRSL